MKNRIGWALVAALALWATAATGQTIGADGVKAGSLGFTRIGGITTADSIGRLLKMDSQGRPQVIDADRDRDFSSVIGVMTANALAAGTTRGGVSAQAVSSFSRLGLMLRWTFAAAADSDSVNIVVKIYAKKSTSIDDGMNHLWTLRGSGIAADSSMMSSVAADSSVLFRAPATYYVTRNRNPKLTVTGAAFGRSVVVPLRMWRQAGNGGIYIPLEDNGVPFNAQYFGIEVSNVNTTTALFTFTAELWPKVN